MLKPTEKDLRKKVVEVGRKLAGRGFVAATDGNISVRLPNGFFLATPTNMNKGEVKEPDVLVVDIEGRTRYGRKKLTSEFLMHQRVYEQREDVAAVVHAHPPIATGFACAGEALDEPVSSEVILALGKVPLAPYGTPGTPELPDNLMSCLCEHDAVLLSNHGAVTFGRSLDEAYGRMESVEQYAKIILVTRLLGKKLPLPAEEVAKIVESRSVYFGSAK